MKYFDNCATTAVDKETAKVMEKALTEEFFNPSSSYGAKVRDGIASARQSVASALKCSSDDLYFTGSGTEALNTAIFGTLPAKGKIVTSLTEHAAVYNSMEKLKSEGFEVVFAPLKKDGSVNTELFGEVADAKTVMVALMHVNNETGAVNDIKKLCAIAKRKNPSCIFVCDGVQALGKIPVNLIDLNVDFYAVAAHKLHGPKGIGALYVKNGVEVRPLLCGGGQEKGLRSGTENVSAIYGFGRAASLSVALINENTEKFKEYRKLLINSLDKNVGDYIQIAPGNSAPHIVALAFAGVKSKMLTDALEKRGFLVSSGSACHSKGGGGRVASAIKLNPQFIEGILRISFCKHNSYEEVTLLAENLVSAVKEVRKINTTC